MKKQSNEWKINQGSLTPCRSISESIQLQHIPVIELYKPQYSKLQQLLLGKGFYEPIFLNEYAPEDRHARKNWFCGLELGVPTMLYRFMHGNNLGTLNFLWKTPMHGGDATANARLVTELNSHQKVYSTREMRRDFIQRYARLSNVVGKTSKAVLRNMYKFLTDDCSSSRTATEKEVDSRIYEIAEEVFELDEPEILIDMRRMNGKPNSSMFNEFWDELALLVEEVNPAVDE